MTRGPDIQTRTLEVLRAVADGAEIVSQILRKSSYESVSNVRRICVDLAKQKLLTSELRFAKRPARIVSTWAHGPRSWHFELTDLGRERLAELEDGSGGTPVG